VSKVPYINPLNNKHGMHLKSQSVPRSKRIVSVINSDHLMLYMEMISASSEIHTN